MPPIPLREVDAVAVTTLIDNSSDALLPDEGLVRRWGLFGRDRGRRLHGRRGPAAAGLPSAFRPNAVGSRFQL